MSAPPQRPEEQPEERGGILARLFGRRIREHRYITQVSRLPPIKFYKPEDVEAYIKSIIQVLKPGISPMKLQEIIKQYLTHVVTDETMYALATSTVDERFRSAVRIISDSAATLNRYVAESLYDEARLCEEKGDVSCVEEYIELYHVFLEALNDAMASILSAVAGALHANLPLHKMPSTLQTKIGVLRS
jgi:hypothetical protein